MENQQVPQAAEEPKTLGLGIEHIRTVFSADFEVVHPLERDDLGKPKGTGLFITLAGPEHPTRKAISMNITRAVRAAMSKKAVAGERVMPDMKDPEVDAAEQLENLAQCTLGWHRKDGQPCAPFSPEAVRALYKNPEMVWLVDQVLTRFNSATLFIKA